LEPEVFGKHSRPMERSAMRSRTATSAHSTIVAGGPGSRSKARMTGAAGSSIFASDEGRQVVADAELDLVGELAADPVRPVPGALLLVEVAALDAVGVALERQRPVAQVRQHVRRDARVVVDHLPLGEADGGEHDLVEVAQ
jgi:hypothetical protein